MLFFFKYFLQHFIDKSRRICMNNFGKFGTAFALASFMVATHAAPIAYEVNKTPANDNWSGAANGYVWKNGTDELCWRDNFWTPATANALCDGAPAKVVAKPAVAPVQQQVVQTQTRQPVSGAFTLGADGAYALGSAVITPKGKSILDAAIAKLANYELNSLVISGYTDSQGTDKINAPLSKNRAKSVNDYLASKGVPASKMSHEGYGSINYVVNPSTCNGMKVNGRPVSRTVCEAPNRRVEVKFNGYEKEAAK
jgi:OOP family OmpA-OmpF porin